MAVVVREVTQHRVWFAEPLLSGATDEIRQLFVRAKQIADMLHVKVVLWNSDKQDPKNQDLDNHHGGVLLRDGLLYGSKYGRDWACLDWVNGRASAH